MHNKASAAAGGDLAANCLRNACARLGLSLSPEHAKRLLARLRSHVTSTKRTPGDAELMRLHAETQPSQEPAFTS